MTWREGTCLLYKEKSHVRGWHGWECGGGTKNFTKGKLCAHLSTKTSRGTLMISTNKPTSATSRHHKKMWTPNEIQGSKTYNHVIPKWCWYKQKYINFVQFRLICICPSLASNHLGQCDENDMYAKSDNQKCRSFFLSGGDMLVTNVYLMPSRFCLRLGWHPNTVATWRKDPPWICQRLKTCGSVPLARHRKG